MKLHEIEKIYTDIVNGYFAEGYLVNVNTMSGSQGEICKVDLRKGDEVIRVLMEHKMIDWDWALTITVGRAKETEKGLREIIWNDGLDVIESLEFYELGIRNGDRYFGEKSEAEESRKKRKIRNMGRYNYKTMDSEGIKKAAWKVLKKQKGMKSIPSSSIKKVFIIEGYGMKEVKAHCEKNGRLYTELLYAVLDAEK